MGFCFTGAVVWAEESGVRGWVVGLGGGAER